MRSLTPITLPADPVEDLEAATKQYVDAGGGGAHAATHEDGGADEIDVTGLTGAGSPADILDIPTAETDDTLVLAPDGAGGVEFRAETGGGSFAPVSQFAAASVNASSSTPTAKTGGPAVTVTVGASGSVLMSWGATIIINSATTSRVASMPITMTGANSGQVAGRILRTRNSPATFTVDHSDTTLVAGLTPGSTTFTALYACSTDNADFTDRELIVTPI